MGLVVREVVAAPRAGGGAVPCACGVPPDVHELNAAAVSITGASVNGHITAPLWSAMQRASRFSRKGLPGIMPTGRIRQSSVFCENEG